MRPSTAVATFLSIAALPVCAVAQPASETRGIPPRTSPAEYQAQAKAGNVTVVADFTGHSIAAPERTLTTDDYVVVEVGFFGPSDSRLKLSIDDFSLRVNGKKAALPCQPFIRAFESLKDPDWEPPSAKAKSKTSIGGSGKGDQGDSNLPPPPVHIPIEVRHAMEQEVRKAALPEGERSMPQAGLIFFQYRGKTQGIHSIELIYNGPAGSATLPLQP